MNDNIRARGVPRQFQRIFKDCSGFVGTCSFASQNAHEAMDLGRRDDIQSWLYTVMAMTQGQLPWPGSKDREATYEMKKHRPIWQLCQHLPRQFQRIFKDCSGLMFEDKPDYALYERLLDEAVAELSGDNPSRPYDWEGLTPEDVPFPLPRRARPGPQSPDRRPHREESVRSDEPGCRCLIA